MNHQDLIIVRGGGDIATAIIHRLWRSGFRVLVLECAYPSAIRRQVAISEAVYEGEAVVEGMHAVRIEHAAQAECVWAAGNVPVLVDPACSSAAQLCPEIVIDATIAKRNTGMHIALAPMTIALGPGFFAGEDVHAVIETMRGHNLGRIISAGYAAPNTGVPGNIAGYAEERVIHAPARGVLRAVRRIGDTVEQGETIAVIEGESGSIPVLASLSGLIRGLIRDGYPVTKGFKIADIDPRLGEYDNCFTISDKARCIAGSVLELVCGHMMKKWAKERQHESGI